MDTETSGEIRKIRNETKNDRRRDAYFWIVMVVTAVTGPACAIAFSAYNTNQSERKFCALMEASVVQAEGRMAAFRQAPPTTEAGRIQQENAVKSVTLLIDLEHSLGCPST